MNLTSLVTDNVTELLVRILEFTQTRQKVLSRNINNMGRQDFVPEDLAVDEFSDIMNTAIEQHILNQRLVMCDTTNIKSDTDGGLKITPVVDEYAKKLLHTDRDGFLELQISKLMENSINQRIAAELLRDRKGLESTFEQLLD